MDPETECACAKHFIALLLPSQNLKSVLVSIRHGFALLDPSRGRQEEQHTQFACRMETKVVVATTWIPVGIDSDIPGSQLLSDIQPDGHSNLVFDDYRQKSSTFYFTDLAYS